MAELLDHSREGSDSANRWRWDALGADGLATGGLVLLKLCIAVAACQGRWWGVVQQGAVRHRQKPLQLHTGGPIALQPRRRFGAEPAGGIADVRHRARY
jgi:hypothetical protein